MFTGGEPTIRADLADLIRHVPLDLTVHRNEILGIAGVSGNGQKELAEVLVGVRKATAGRVCLNEQEIAGRTPREIMSRGLGHIPEDRLKEGLVPDFSVEENLVLGLHHSPRFTRRSFLDFRSIRKYAHECIESFEIVTPSALQLTRTLSGGNLQRLILARELSPASRRAGWTSGLWNTSIAGCWNSAGQGSASCCSPRTWTSCSTWLTASPCFSKEKWSGGSPSSRPACKRWAC